MKKPITRLFLTLLGISGLALGLTGCNTIDGAGEDIEETGEAISDSTR
jgi:predicted small secreted protein